MITENNKTTAKRQKITDYFSRVNNPRSESSSSSASAINGRAERMQVDSFLGDLQMSTTRSSEADVSQQQPASTMEMTENKDEQQPCFLKLVDVLTDDNLQDLSAVNDTFVLYRQPWVKDQVPGSLQSGDHFSNATNYIKMPFQNNITLEYEGIEINKWQLIENLFSGTIDSVFQLEKAIKAYNPLLKDLEFDLLRGYINYQLNEDEQEYFFTELLPAIIRLALDLPNLITCNLPILDQDTSTALFLSQRQISSLLANAFLCTYTQRYKDDRRSINFSKLYSTNRNEKRKGCKLEKLKCLINYFRRVIQTPPVGTVSFERRQQRCTIRPEECTQQLCNFEINSGQCMFENGSDYAVVDFANKYLGGGVLNSGCVQEEILFVICPELIVGKLFTERMMDGDAVVITGAEQFSEYSGYGDKFKWKCNYRDMLPRDKYGRKCRQIIAMDALYFHWKAISSQYEKDKIDRELFKAMSAFQGERFLVKQNRLPAIATGNWGCGVYHGDANLKTLIQMIAASMMRRDVVYFAFNEEQLKTNFLQVKRLLEANKDRLTVAQLYRITLEFGELKQKMPKLELVTFLSQKLS